MTHITISDTDPVASYTATAGQTQFDVPWPFFTDASLKVYQTPNGQESDDASDLLTLTTDYTVTGAGNKVVATRRITLVSGAEAGDKIVIRRDEPIARSSDLANQGGFSSETYNDEQDLVLMILQQIREEIGRAMVSGVTGAPFDALSKRIQNLPDPTNDNDAANKSWTVAQIAARLAALGTLEYTAPIEIAGTVSAAAFSTYVIANLSGNVLNLPANPNNNDWIRIFNNDLTPETFNINPASGDYIVENYLQGSNQTLDASGNVVTVASGQDNMIPDALVGLKCLNLTDGSVGDITDNDETTITMSGGLSGGTDNQWAVNDTYFIAADEWEHLKSTDDRSWTELFLIYRADLNVWAITVGGGGVLGVNPHPFYQKYNDPIDTHHETLYDYLRALDDHIYGALHPDSTDEVSTETTKTLGMLKTQRLVVWEGSSAATFTPAAPPPTGGLNRNHTVEIVNAGSASITLEKGSWTTFVLIDGGTVSNPTTVTIPAGNWAKIKSNLVDTIYIWGSDGIS